jgi:hypothetical protein
MPTTAPAAATGALRPRSATALLALTLAIGYCAAFTAAAQEGAGAKRSIATRTATPPTIDGRIDEEVWTRATIVEDLHQVTPVEFSAPTERTIVYLLYDNDYLYVAARMLDKEPNEIVARIQRQNQPIGGDDRFFVHLDPFGNRRSGYLFGVNPNGVRFDGVFQNITDRQFDWDGIYQAEALIDEQGWTAELAIPFKTLSFDPNSSTWHVNFVRYIIRRNEQMAWNSRNRNTDPTTMGEISGLVGIEQGTGLDVVPSVSVRERKVFATGATDGDNEPSLDVFYKVTPALNAALTINTDFSATEVDNRQVNLTRFGLFFPEKRDFFLQDLDIFQFASIGRLNTGNDGLENTATTRPSRENGRPFFSRQLGISPTGMEVPLDYGGKLSGRIGRFDVGALSIRQEETPTVDATTTFVGRVAANVLEESSIGIIATSGDPTSNVDNSLVGTDFRYVNNRLAGGRSLEAEAWYQQTDTEGLIGDDSAFGLGVRLPNNTGVRGGLALRRLEENFNPALGYLSRAGIDDWTTEVGRTWRPRNGTIQSIYSGLDAERIEYLSDGFVQSQVLSLRAFEADTRGRDQLRIRLYSTDEGLRAPFEISQGVLLPAGEYSFDEYEVRLATGNQRKFSGSLSYRDGDFFSGERQQIEATWSWRPSRHFRTAVEYEFNDVTLPQGDFVVRLARLTLEAAFSSTLSWVNLIQYDNVSETIGINSRLHWIPQAGREGFVVINHNLDDLDRDNSFHSSFAELTVKFGYTFRF